MDADLVGRTQERERLARLLERARGGQGATVLVSGDAGVGKTRLTGVLAAPGTLVLRGAAVQGRTAPYGPLVEALRDALRAHPGGLVGRRAAARPPRAAAARARGAGRRGRPGHAVRGDARPPSRAIARGTRRGRAGRPAVERRGDARGPRRAGGRRMPLLVVGVYRSDGLPRQHPVRRLRHDLRRAGRLEELVAARRSTCRRPPSCCGTRSAPAGAVARRARSTTARRACRSSSRSSRPRCASAAPSRPGARGLELAGDETCRCPTPCATPC